MPKVDVSFKKTSKEIKLYLAVINQEEKSDFVKKCIDFYIKHTSDTSNHSRDNY